MEMLWLKNRVGMRTRSLAWESLLVHLLHCLWGTCLQHGNNWMKLSWISSPALTFKDPESPSLPYFCYISFMKGGYCLLVSEKQTIDLHLFQRIHVMVLPSRNGWWQLLPHSHPLYQRAQRLACLAASISLGTAVADLLKDTSTEPLSSFFSSSMKARTLHVIRQFPGNI